MQVSTVSTSELGPDADQAAGDTPASAAETAFLAVNKVRVLCNCPIRHSLQKP